MKKTSKKKPPQNYLMGLGVTSVGTGALSILPIAVLSFQGMKTDGKVGDDVENENLSGPITNLYFVNELGIDNLISRLEDARKCLRYVLKESNAAANKPLGRTDKLGPTPRKGKASGVHNTSPSKRRRCRGKSK